MNLDLCRHLKIRTIALKKGRYGLKKYHGYLIDLDGTMYRGTEKIEAAVQFVKRLKKKEKPYLFVTNNSSKTEEQIANDMKSLGIEATPEQIFTTSLATADFLFERSPKARVYMIGEDGLKVALESKGFILTEKNPDAVVVGIDRQVTYNKLAHACLAVRNGALFISTNSDRAIPTEEGLMPGNGAITSVISVSTQVDPIFIGKPNPIILEQALQRLGTERNETLMIGDNYDTDILAGLNCKVDTLLVHTGVTSPKDLLARDRQPTYVVNSLADWDI